MAKRAQPGALAESGAHIYYAQDALKRRNAEAPGYWAYQPGSGPPVSPGDILIRSRGDVRGQWPAVLNQGVFIESHGDIVTSVSRGTVAMVGGNVNNAVSLTTDPLDGRGQVTGGKWIAHLVRRGTRPKLGILMAAGFAMLPALGIVWIGKALRK
jgi:hypothetical protein